MSTADFVVIGAGMAGASVAAELSRTSRVIVLEAEAAPGFHSTGRSAALFSEVYGNDAVRALTRASRRELFSPSEAFSERAFCTPRGVLFIANSDQFERLRAFVSAPQSAPFITMIDKEEALRLCPALRASVLAGAAYEQAASDIDVNGLHQAYLRKLKGNGGQVITAARVSSLAWRGSNWDVRAGDTAYRAPVVINAAGAWADEMAKLADVVVCNIQPRRRTAMLVDAPTGASIAAWPMVLDIDETFYVKPDAGALLISPADEEPVSAGDVQAEELDIAIGIDRATQAMDLSVRSVRHRWAGLRSFAPDRTPVVGFDDRQPGFFWLAGQGGYGIQTAPAMARLAAALACGLPVPADLVVAGVRADDLSPGRFNSATT